MNFSQYVIAILITGISLLSPDPPIGLPGFGFPAKKVDSYKGAVANEPVQFTGLWSLKRY